MTPHRVGDDFFCLLQVLVILQDPCRKLEQFYAHFPCSHDDFSCLIVFSFLLSQDMNVYELIRGRRHYVAEERVKSFMYQLMKAMDHMHRNGIFHR